MALYLTEIEEQAVNALKENLIKHLPNHIRSITLFGSKARGEGGPYSDIDLLVTVDQEELELWDKIQEISSEISIEYDVLLSVKVMDLPHLELLRNVQSGFIRNIEKEGSVIWKAA
ncbi:MAG: nucleotidyltransferase domain-containing protein [Candidatus Aquicultor sp.]|nr:nucleotidyltransferase domain-containing protein [Candidatus Aquicultor sp.]